MLNVSAELMMLATQFIKNKIFLSKDTSHFAQSKCCWTILESSNNSVKAQIQTS